MMMIRSLILLSCVVGMAATAAAATAATSLINRAVVQGMIDTKQHVLHANSKHHERWLQEQNVPSAECTADREFLLNNTAINSTYAAIETEYEAANQDCIDGFERDDFRCEINEDDFASTQAFRDACTGGDGLVYQVDLEIVCDVSGNGQSETIVVRIINGDVCDAESCSIEATIEEMDEFTAEFDDLVNEIEDLQDDQISVDCRTSTELRDPNGAVVYESAAVTWAHPFMVFALSVPMVLAFVL